MKNSTLNQVKKRLKLMERYLNNPASAHQGFLASCSSQETFGNFVSEELGLDSVSVNSMKIAAEEVLEDGGWLKFDEKRRTVKGLLRPSQSIAQKDALSEAKTQARDIDKADRARLLIGRAYNDLQLLVRSFADHNHEIAEKLKRHNALWREQLDLPIKKAREPRD